MSSPLPKHFEPRGLDSKWCGRWESEGWFSSGPRAGREPYSIVLPPPNVTGTLHMGHAFQHTLMDALSRRARMSGKDTLWQPGVDHAGIATQIVVTRELERAGVDPGTLSREEFLARVWEWKEKSGSEITRQMRRMGASCDWSRERFTMDAGLSRVVTDVFVRLHREGLIYRGKRVINWDPTLLTAVSDLEVSAKEEDGWLHHVRYPFADGDGGVTVATTRPETMLGDTAVAVHPDDERWRALVGRRVRVPLTGRAVPVVADGFVDPGFGSGCVKITPGHDAADHACSLRHPEIGTLMVLTPDARINDNAPAAYRGLDRLEARRRVVEDLRAEGLLERSEPHRHSPPRGDRSGALLEPMLTDQWFVRARPLAEKALGPTRSGEMSFVPGNWRRVYERWLEDIEDWCISRQLMWGHRIPAWHRADGEVFVARDEREAREAAGEDAALERDPDVLDTWFSSALWPLSTLGWPDADDPHFRAYFPTSALVTGFDIIFFWVARMVMMSVHFTGKAPFREVYITGLVRDAHGEKMSKSKGNTLDPLDLVDGIGLEALVEKRTQGLMNPGLAKEIGSKTRAEYPEGIPAFGADALRLTFASLASYGRDIKFDLGRCAGYRNFCNKLWNAARYVLATAADAGADGARAPTLADRWIVSRLQRAAAAVSAAFDAYRFDLASQEIYQLVWDEYCDWYLEAAKIQIAKGSPEEARSARHTLACVLEAALRLAHPLIPFVTEELWQQVAPLATGRPVSGSILGAPCPVTDGSKLDAEAEEWMAALKGMVEGCRRLCSEAGASRPAHVEVWVDGDPAALARLEPWFSGLARVSKVRHGEAPEQSLPRFRAGGHEVAVRAGADPAEAAGRLRRRRERLEADIRAVSAKLDNPRFVERAPAEVVGRQRRRLKELREEMALVDGRLGGADAAGSTGPDRLAD